MLQCVAQNNLDAPNDLMFTWRHNGSNIQDDSRRIITPSPEDAAREASSILMVMNVTRYDGGEYECTASNREIIDGASNTSFVTVYCKWSVLFTVVTANGNAYTLLDEDIHKRIVGTIFEYTSHNFVILFTHFGSEGLSSGIP